MEELRRFHFGDPAAQAAPLPTGVLPAALHPYRGKPVRSGWPLLVDLAATGESWIRALALAERVRLGEGKLELAANTTLVPFGRRAPLKLAALAARRRLTVARNAFAGEAQELAATAEALLTGDRARQPEGLVASARVETMGALGARFVEPAGLAKVVGRRRVGAPFPEARRRRLEAARDRLATFETAAEPLWIVALGESSADLGAPAREANPAGSASGMGDLCAAAAAAFDELACEAVELARAVRTVRLEAADAFAPDRHEAWLERLDWRGLAQRELLLVPPVLVLLADGEPFVSALPGLSALLLSGRPVQIVVLTGDEPQPDRLSYRLEPAYLGVAHREAFVQQGSIAFPLPLAAGFSRAFASRRAGLHVVDAPGPAHGSDIGGGDELDAWLVASARVSGRAAPLFRFDPEAGASWARRLYFDENPEPAADWPTEPLPAGSDASHIAGAPREAAFTFADAALLDPVCRSHFAGVTPSAAADGELTPLAEWLGLDEEESVRHLPFIWGADADGALLRVVVSRTLAFATRDRLAYWRTLEELAGVRNEHVLAAVERARSDMEAHALLEREELASRHAAELANLRETADQRAVDRLISILFEIAPTLAPPLAPVRIQDDAAAITPLAQAPTAAEAPPDVSSGRSAEAPKASAAEEAWIDTALCTSCDECTRKYPGIFAYNGNKQAFVQNPRGGSFRDLVIAAEACTAKIIHPGSPWNPAEPDLERSRERARAFG